MVIPDAFDKLAVLFDDRHQLGQHMRRETPIIGQNDFGTKPSLGMGGRFAGLVGGCKGQMAGLAAG